MRTSSEGVSGQFLRKVTQWSATTLPSQRTGTLAGIARKLHWRLCHCHVLTALEPARRRHLTWTN